MPFSSIASIAAAAVTKLEQDIQSSLPSIWPLLVQWRDPRSFATGGLDPRSFPAITMPFWVSADLLREDPQFSIDLSCSTMHGYLFLRLVDDATDGDGDYRVRKLLPISGYLASRFQEAYQTYFPASHSFWEYFRLGVAEQADSSAADAMISKVDEDWFLRVSSRKTSVSKIPVAAAALRLGKESDIALWYQLIDKLGRLQQFSNDFFGCHHDLEHQIETLVLSTYYRERSGSQTLSEWLVEEGFSWGVDMLRHQLADLTPDAARLKSRAALAWLRARALSLEIDIQRALRRLHLALPLSERQVASPAGTTVS